jgi:imidazole glycerol phosphate synthase subunit HisF
VVVSVDPRRVYVSDPGSTTHKTTETSKLGPDGERYVWWQCTVKGGREGRDLGAVELSQAVEQLGAGEILLNCIDNDGQVSVDVPKGTRRNGCMQHFGNPVHVQLGFFFNAAGLYPRS